MRRNLTRREVGKLSVAALAGAVIGCKKQEGEPAPAPAPAESGGEPAGGGDAYAAMMEEPHVCRGLNTCQGKGAGGDNACAGQGKCATAKAHQCGGQNECKGQGGCGSAPGTNACKGKGDCAVPLEADAWQSARKNFETAMKAAGKTVGEAPPAG